MELAPPQLKFFADAQVQVGTPHEIGIVPRGKRRVIGILGGDFHGDGWHARVLAGGADFQLLVGETLAELDARYTIELDGGDLVYVQNRAIRSGPADAMARIARGEPVDPSLIYFRCSPTFETASRSLAWINERMFVGTGQRKPDRVVMRFWQLA